MKVDDFLNKITETWYVIIEAWLRINAGPCIQAGGRSDLYW